MTVELTPNTEEHVVIPFEKPQLKLLPSDPTGPNWLLHLPDGTRFLGRHKTNKTFVLNEFLKCTTFGSSVMMMEIDPNSRDGNVFYVDSGRFSDQTELVQQLPTPDRRSNNEENQPLQEGDG